jgi:hypothetical protein
VDKRFIENNLDYINSTLETATERPYQNAPIFLAQLRGNMERFGINIPGTATKHFLDLSAELVFNLSDTGYHLYIVFDTSDDGYVDAYAQIVDSVDLKDLIGTEPPHHDPIAPNKPSYARREDDGGNTSEY